MDYFPTIDPQTMDYFLITSLDPIFEVAGTPLPFDVWLHVKAGVSLDQAEKAIRDVGFPVLRFADPHTLLLEAQAEPGRRGVLGFLSVGFLAAVSLTLIGTVIQGTASFQAQSSQLGSLRAMGMSSLSVRIYVLLLQGLIAISGVGSGTLIGLATTLLFLPLFDFSGGLPPYQLRIAWGDIQIVYSVFGTILILLALMMAFVLTRQQLAKAVKLGNI
jgi:putative ABC transport system permease protein